MMLVGQLYADKGHAAIFVAKLICGKLMAGKNAFVILKVCLVHYGASAPPKHFVSKF